MTSTHRPEDAVLPRRSPEAPSTLSVVIPALNEESSIAGIVARIDAVRGALRSAGIEDAEILVVDDGSKDRTAEIAARLPGVTLVRHTANRGYGAALKTGFSRARGELLAFLDADGTYPPEFLPVLCQAAIGENADVVVGSRRSGGDSRMPAVRRLGNLIWSSLVSVLGNCRCADPASGMRVLRRSALARLYPLPDGLNFTPVMSTRAMHEKLKVVELAIPYSERAGQSKLSVVHDGTRFLKTILGTALEYDPAKVLGLAGLVMTVAAAAIGLALVLMRASGVTTLGPWGAFSVFAALLLAVGGLSIYSLGLTFGFLVALFRSPRLERSTPGRMLESHFGWLGGCSIGLGVLLSAASMLLGASGWEIGRIWLWLLGSALFVLVGLQLVITWILVRVVEKLFGRAAAIEQIGRASCRERV